ncbi:transcription factor HHO6-like [Zingiber officinale]|uniref:transcription factor HHO6-like n=1 Tax=Zingiber officinale TaxID=94328 RepID=UPI001C4B6510|nr:transcription factor HHO6-like [Zingiber officinale]
MASENRDVKVALRERHILKMEEEKKKVENLKEELPECNRLFINALQFMENKLEKCSGKRCVRVFGRIMSTSEKLDEPGHRTNGSSSVSMEDAGHDLPPTSPLLPKKARRYWTEELHCRFLKAVEQLGGAQLATPKQIKEQMDVEGLTSDQVRSHLQKHRLSMRERAGLSFHLEGGDARVQREEDEGEERG